MSGNDVLQITSTEPIKFDFKSKASQKRIIRSNIHRPTNTKPAPPFVPVQRTVMDDFWKFLIEKRQEDIFEILINRPASIHGRISDDLLATIDRFKNADESIFCID